MKRIAKAVLISVTVLSTSPWSAPDAAQGSADTAPLSKEQLDQLVAPIALYPDALLAQILMASTYPLEVVEAARWVKQNPDVKGDALEDAMQKQAWDPSVKSLTAFPQVLNMMDDELVWTQKLGDAFLAQQKEVMAAVQRLRAKAKAEGNLESNEQQKVVVEEVPAGGGAAGSPSTTVIQIVPASPQVVYVPTYNPTVVYGTWPYPSYPPYAWYPQGYVATSMISFGVGLAVGSALWGNCNWGYGDVNINVNRYNEFNRTNISNTRWEHNVDHRKGVPYRDRSTSQRYGRDAQRSQAREQFRGRAEQGRQDLARRGTGERGAAAARDRSGRAGGDPRARADARSGQRGSGAGGGRERVARHPTPSAFDGIGSGREVRRSSERGRMSRQSAMSSGYGGGGGRSSGFGGGGGMRGGGGGGGGLGGRGGRR